MVTSLGYCAGSLAEGLHQALGSRAVGWLSEVVVGGGLVQVNKVSGQTKVSPIAPVLAASIL